LINSSGISFGEPGGDISELNWRRVREI
jgi:hypothetical protein